MFHVQERQLSLSSLLKKTSIMITSAADVIFNFCFIIIFPRKALTFLVNHQFLQMIHVN